MPQDVVKEYDEKEKRSKPKRTARRNHQNETTQLAESLALQASKYMQAAWRISGEPKDRYTK